MSQIGELKKYKIGEIAKIAGVSRRTIDYYSNLGLLKPCQVDHHIRYYSDESILRLKLIEGMKKRRMTLEEIKEHIQIMDKSEQTIDESGFRVTRIDGLRERISKLGSYLVLFQPMISETENPNYLQLTEIRDKLLSESLDLIQELMIFINNLPNI